MRHQHTSLGGMVAGLLAWIAATAAVLGPAVSFAHEDHAPLPTKGVTVAGNNVLLSEKARESIGLTTAQVTLGDLHRTVEVNAKVELPWDQQAMITSLVPGKIDRVLARPGETVARGQVLARVVSMELESLQLALLQAGTAVDLAERLVKQRKELESEGVIAGKSLLEAQSELAEKTAALRIAEQKLLALGFDAAKVKEIRTTGQPLPSVAIASPIKGVITHADVRLGQVVAPTDHLYHVVDPRRVWIVGEVLESDVRHLERGQAVTARFAAHPGKTFPGRIDHIRLKMNRQTRTQSVVILVDNEDGLLRPGMFGRASIAVQVAEQAIVCPADAVLKSRSGKYALVERKPGKYESRPIKLGLEKGDRVEVLEGVFPGDKVVVRGAFLLASLLGNEHKARTSGGGKTESAGTPPTSERPVAVADATIELPTSRQAYATPRIEGRVRSVPVTPSQHVDAGQVLAEIDSLELRTAQLDFLQSVARLRLTKGSLDRLAQLGNGANPERRITPERRIWELKTEHQSLVHLVEGLKRRLKFFGLTDEQIRKLEEADLTDPSIAPPLVQGVPIRAPAPGWIVSFDVVPGQVVHSHDQLFEIHDLSKVWAKGYVFERDAARVAVGQPARVTFAAFPELEAVGRVVRVAPMMEDSARVLPVWVEVDNPDRLLKEGMLARVTVLAHSATVPDNPADVAKIKPAEARR